MTRPPLLPLLWLLSCLSLAACGGNTSGTGDQSGDGDSGDGDSGDGDGDSGDGDTGDGDSGDGDSGDGDTGDGDSGDGDSGDGDSGDGDTGDGDTGDGDSGDGDTGDGDTGDGDTGDGDTGDGDTGDGDDSGDLGDPEVDASGRRLLYPSVLKRKAVSYSGYRRGQRPGEAYPSEEEIREDLHLLVQAGYGAIRLFDSGTHAERVLKVIDEDDLNIKVALGIWIEGSKAEHDALNQADIARGIKLASDYKHIVATVSVGNENLDYWSSVLTPASDLADYIKQVRDQVRQPVCTDDLYPPFLLDKGPNWDYTDVIKVLEAVDFLSVHIYPFIDAPWDSWDWKQTGVSENERARAMMDAALEYAKDMIASVKAKSLEHGIDMPIVIGEGGWKDTTKFGGDTNDASKKAERFMAHPVNQKWMYDDFTAWVYGEGDDPNRPLALYYFEAFDEPWKDGDDHWGLWDVDRKAKYVLWSRVPELKPEGAQEPDASDAVCYSE